MKEVAARIRDGSTADLPKLGHPSVGTTGRGIAPPVCNHWLGNDRLTWFGKIALASGPLTDAGDEVLRDEFCSPLSTLVGGQLVGLPLPESHFGQLDSWANPDFPSQPSHTSPNNIPEIGFSVRTTSPSSVPFLRTESLRLGGSQPVSVPFL